MHQTSSEASARSSAGRISPRVRDEDAAAAERLHHPIEARHGQRGADRALLRRRTTSCGLRIWPQPPSLPTMHGQRQPEAHGGLHLHPVEAEGAVARDRAARAGPGCRSLAAIANDGPTPRQPNGPGSSHCPGAGSGTILDAQPTTSPPSPTTMVSGVDDAAAISGRPADSARSARRPTRRPASSFSRPSRSSSPTLRRRHSLPARRQPAGSASRSCSSTRADVAGDADVERPVPSELGRRRSRPGRRVASSAKVGGRP